MANTIDERLLAAQLADQQRQARMAKEDKERQGQMAKEDQKRQAGEPAGGGSGSLRERWRAARQAMNLKQKAKDKIAEKVTTPARAGTNRALQWAWKSLIPSWGLSAIWINIHVFLKGVFGEKLFCKFGDEWLPAQADAVAGEAVKTVKRSIGLVEVMVLIFIDVIIFFIIVGFVSMFTDESTFKAMTGEANKTQPPAVQPIK